MDTTTSNYFIEPDYHYTVLNEDGTAESGVVTVSENLTKDEIKNITSKPTLTFTAYAVQKDGIADAETAWAKANPTA